MKSKNLKPSNNEKKLMYLIIMLNAIIDQSSGELRSRIGKDNVFLIRLTIQRMINDGYKKQLSDISDAIVVYLRKIHGEDIDIPNDLLWDMILNVFDKNRLYKYIGITDTKKTYLGDDISDEYVNKFNDFICWVHRETNTKKWEEIHVAKSKQKKVKQKKIRDKKQLKSNIVNIKKEDPTIWNRNRGIELLNNIDDSLDVKLKNKIFTIENDEEIITVDTRKQSYKRFSFYCKMKFRKRETNEKQ